MSSPYAPCAACKYLRRKCTNACVFSPYFPPENPQKFINVHKVFGASNVGKILNELDPIQRNDAVKSLAYEAECRIQNPIYGCVGSVAYLQHQLRQVYEEIERARKELTTYVCSVDMQPILDNQTQLLMHEPPQQSMVSGDQEMLRVYVQQQQEQFYFHQQQQQQEMYAHQQQRVYQQQFNNSGDFGPENHYQTQKQEQDHNLTQKFPIQDLLLQGQQQFVQYQEFAVAQPQSSQGKTEVIEEERASGSL